jgi:peptidoglycan/LPS O-acetylase OafA/YrhL
MDFFRPLLVVNTVACRCSRGGRDNNFTLIRLVFAAAVLFGHSYAIGNSGSDPISRFMGVWIGDLAVNGFFVFSGFLVTASFQRAGLIRFVILRIARIFPAAIVCISLSVLVGAAISTLKPADYFAHSLTWTYAGNATLFYLSWFLPGVFEGQPFNGSVNGSFWSVVLEARCYFYLLIAGFFGMLATRARTNAAVLVAFLCLQWIDVPLIDSEGWILPCVYFLIGILLWTNRDFIVLHWALAVLAVTVLVSGLDSHSYPFAVAWSYLLFFLVYGVPSLNVENDISYGLYLYAWPIQQLVWSKEQVGIDNVLLAAPLIFAAATLSWFLVEKPILHFARKQRAAVARSPLVVP